MRYGIGTSANWSVAILAAVILVTAPLTADRFIPEANGYRLRDAEDLAAAATWIDTHLARTPRSWHPPVRRNGSKA